MKKLNIKGEFLKALGYPQEKAIRMAIQVIEQKIRTSTKEEVLAILYKVFQTLENF